MLRKNLKKVAKQQAGRLHEALICERSWHVTRWRTLFVDHPLLGLLAQGLIWQRVGDNASFRISEDGSLIDADDEPLTLGDSDRLRLWHPTNASAEQAAAWAGHLEDYQLSPLVDQLGQPRVKLQDQEPQAEQLTRFVGVEVEQFIAKRFLEGWNYEIHDQDGSAVFGYQRRFPLLGVTVVIDLEGMDAFSYPGSTTKVGTISFFRPDRKTAAAGQGAGAAVGHRAAPG